MLDIVARFNFSDKAFSVAVKCNINDESACLITATDAVLTQCFISHHFNFI